MEGRSRKTIEQSKEEGRSEVGQGLIAFSLGDRSQPRITADFGIGNKIMVGDSLREVLKNILPLHQNLWAKSGSGSSPSW